ncbi:hypothetical protein SNEBB_004544 [Seison nebaliae]|nr:hypothetical protein SNEBB_004544 [Seison nebaliae]
MWKLFIYFVFIYISKIVVSLDNGLARTPPMGWMTWERYRCNTDCVNYPDSCISERLILEQAEYLISEGYKDAGYEYIILDDCWLSHNRTKDGKLQADPIRFPRGIKFMSDTLHSMGLKFGLYEDYGTKTCGGYPGILGHLELDAQTFASWDVDYIKLDCCYSAPSTMDSGYTQYGYYLNQTKRPIVYSCSMPACQLTATYWPNYELLEKICNLWRNYDDVQDNWNSVSTIADWYVNNQDRLIPHAGPGHWNDPDMLIVGNFGLSMAQSRTQMALWSILASPLLMSTNLKKVANWQKDILQNREAIRINQDALGNQGRMIGQYNGMSVFRKELSNFQFAFVIHQKDGAFPLKFNQSIEIFNLTPNFDKWMFSDIFEGKFLGILQKSTKSRLVIDVDPTGSILLMVKPLLSKKMEESYVKSLKDNHINHKELEKYYENLPVPN